MLSPVASAQPAIAATPTLHVSGELDDYEALAPAQWVPLLGKALDRAAALPPAEPLGRLLASLIGNPDALAPAKRLDAAIVFVRLWIAPGVDVLVRDEDGLKAALELCSAHIGEATCFLAAAELLGQFALLVEQLPQDDAIVFRLEDVCLHALQLPDSSAASRALQRAAVGLLLVIFNVCAPHHRQHIVCEVLSVVAKLPASREFHVPSFAHGSADVYIQMVSALFLGAAQVCNGSSDNDNDDDDDAAKNAVIASARDVCLYFSSLLLDRCNKDVKEYAPVLVRLVEDCCAVVLAPEFPIAEQVVTTLTGVLTKALSVGSLSAQCLVVMVDLLGKVMSTAQAHWMTAQSSAEPPTTAAVNRAATPDDEGEVNACACGKGFEGRFMIDCGQCKRWYHGACVGVNEMDKGLAKVAWFCGDCALLARVSVPADLVRLHLARRAKAETANVLVKSALGLFPASAATASPDANRVVVTRASASSALLKIHVASGPSSPDARTALLRVLCKHASLSPHSSIRARALKAVAHAVHADAGLLKTEAVRHAIEASLAGDAVSVRDAVLELLGKCGAIDASLLEPYKPVLLALVSDPGLAVRKRAVKLVRDSMLRAGALDLLRVVHTLALRLDDASEEDSVRELVGKALGELWFGSGCLDGLVECAGKPWLVAVVRDAVQHKPCPALVEALLARAHEHHDAMRVLKILCQADAGLVIPHARHVARVLCGPKAAGLDARLVADACEICAMCVGHEDARLDVAALEGALQRVLYTQRPSAMAAAVSCLQALSAHTRRAATRALHEFAAVLRRTEARECAALSPHAKSNTERSLVCVGLLAKAGFGSSAAVLPCLEPFCASAVGDETIRKRALQALAHVCSTYPRDLVANGPAAVLLAQGLRDASPLIRAQVLACFNDMLESAVRDKDDARSSLLTSFVQGHAAAVMDALGDAQQPRVCLAACTLVRALLELGAVHHQQCIVPLVKACGIAEAHEAALRALAELHARHKMLPALVAKGVMACVDDAALLRPVYSRFVQPDRASRRRFLELCVGKLMGGDGERALVDGDVDAALFMGRALVCLDYATFDEVVFVLTELRRLAHLRSDAARDRLKAAVGPLAKAMQRGMPWTEPVPEVDTAVRQDALGAQIACVALRVAHFLCSTFRVTAARLKDFADAPHFTAASEKALPAPLPDPPREFGFLGARRAVDGAEAVAAVLNELSAALKRDDGPLVSGMSSPLIKRGGKPRRKRAKRGPSSDEEDDLPDAAVAPVRRRSLRERKLVHMPATNDDDDDDAPDDGNGDDSSEYSAED